MTVTLTLLPEVAQVLQAKAIRNGKTLESYLTELAEQDAQRTSPLMVGATEISLEEFDRLVDELSDGPTLPRLPDDFSRADIYVDHD
jgi:hypothetical protein